MQKTDGYDLSEKDGGIHLHISKLFRQELFCAARAKTDPKPTGNQASYEHVLTELNGHSATSVARAVYDKFVNKTPYPSTFSDRAQAKMNEMFLLLAIVEPYRSDYAWAIFTASIQAVINGASLEDTFYKGKGQVEALHAGASSFKGSGVSGPAYGTKPRDRQQPATSYQAFHEYLC